MPSFQITLSPTKRVKGRFVSNVRRSLQKALAEENRLHCTTQADIAREIGVHRSVINRELRGVKDITVGRVAEIAYVLRRRAILALPERVTAAGSNQPAQTPSAMPGPPATGTSIQFDSHFPSQTASPIPVLAAA